MFNNIINAQRLLTPVSPLELVDRTVLIVINCSQNGKLFIVLQVGWIQSNLIKIING